MGKTNEIQINLEKVIIDNCVYYKLLENEEQKLSNDIFEVVELNGQPIAAIPFGQMVDNGDYDYDDEYIPNYEMEYSYQQIYFSPMTGQKIVFCITQEIDVTKEYQESNDILDKYMTRKRLTKEEKELLEKAYKTIDEIKKGFILEI